MAFANESAKVLIHPDGTFTFERKAVLAFRLANAHSISVFYSFPSSRFVLQPVQEGTGVPLERVAGGIVARQAADFLGGVGVLPARKRKYDAQYDADTNMIVVRNVSVCKRGNAK